MYDYSNAISVSTSYSFCSSPQLKKKAEKGDDEVTVLVVITALVTWIIMTMMMMMMMTVMRIMMMLVVVVVMVTIIKETRESGAGEGSRGRHTESRGTMVMLISRVSESALERGGEEVMGGGEGDRRCHGDKERRRGRID